jgi:hypothetical protein
VRSGGTILYAAGVGAVTPHSTGATFAILHAIAHFTAIPFPGLAPARVAPSTQVFP